MRATIQSVTMRDGARFNKDPKWRHPMQVIVTSAGTYIDNEPGRTIGGWVAPDYSKLQNKVVDFDVVHSKGEEWMRLR